MRFDFTPAQPQEDALLRQLLREPMQPGWVDMTLEREPSFFAGSGQWGQEFAVLCRHQGELVGMFTCTRQQLWVNGQKQPTTYLGGLRVLPRWRHRAAVQRQGFAAMARLVPPSPWRLTSIARSNRRARRLLEAGVAGLPRYQPLGRLTTLALARPRRRSATQWAAPQPDELPELLEFHGRHNQGVQFAPVLDSTTVQRIGLQHFRIWRQQPGQQMVACAAYWNQQPFRQLVARRYARWVGWLRPVYNLLARLLGGVLLPAQGQALEQTFLAFLTFAPGAPRTRLVEELVAHCPGPVAVLGTSPQDPLARRPGFRLDTVLYSVDPSEPLRPGPILPEAALL